MFVNSHYTEPGMTLKTVTDGEDTFPLKEDDLFLSKESHYEDSAYFKCAAII